MWRTRGNATSGDKAHFRVELYHGNFYDWRHLAPADATDPRWVIAVGEE